MLKKTGIVLVLLVTASAATTQNLRFEITGYDANVAGIAPDYKEIIITPMHFDANGMRQGKARIYSIDDTKQEKPLFAGTWKDGRLVDTAYWYFSDGQLKRRAVFADNSALAQPLPWPDAKNVGNGTLHGEATTWKKSRNGTYISTVENYIGGKRSGMSYYYIAEGYLFYQVEYRNGQLNGNYTMYHSGGRVNTEGYYENDKKEGTWNTYDEAGVLTAIEIYRNNLLEDSVVYFHPNGKLKMVSFFVSGRLNGDHRQYDTLGRISYYCHYGADARRDSVEINYYQDGHVKDRCGMVRDERNGPFMAWHENGKSAASGMYRNGARAGMWLFYNTSGKQVSKRDYDKNPEDPMVYVGEVVEEEVINEVENSYEEVAVLPVFIAFKNTVVVGPQHTIRFPRKVKFIDLDARVEKDGSVRYDVTSVLPEKAKQQLLNWLNANYSRAEPFNYNGRPQNSTIHFRVYITS